MAASKKRKFDGEGDVDGDDPTYGREKVKKVVKRRRTKKDKKTTMPKEDLIMKLPGELRNRIYELSLGIEDHSESLDPIVIHPRKVRGIYHDGDLDGSRRRRWREPALLLVCKQIRAEAITIYYASPHFVICASLNDLGKLYKFVNAKTDEIGGDWPFRLTVEDRSNTRRQKFHVWTGFHIFITRFDGSAIASLIWLAKLVYENKLHDNSVAECEVWYAMLGIGNGNWAGHNGRRLTTMMSEVVRLALKAKTRGVSYKWLEEDMHEWAMAKVGQFQQNSYKWRHAGLAKKTMKEIGNSMSSLPWMPIHRRYQSVAPTSSVRFH